MFTASASYFETLRIPLVRGRLFEASDRIGGPEVALVSQSAAQRYWKGKDPVGARITFGDPADQDVRWMTVVGVVGDVRQEGPAAAAYPQIYVPLEQSPDRSCAGGPDLRRSAGARAGRSARHRGDRPRSRLGRRHHAGGARGGGARPAAGERHGARRLRR